MFLLKYVCVLSSRCRLSDGSVLVFRWSVWCEVPGTVQSKRPVVDGECGVSHHWLSSHALLRGAATHFNQQLMWYIKMAVWVWIFCGYSQIQTQSEIIFRCSKCSWGSCRGTTISTSLGITLFGYWFSRQNW